MNPGSRILQRADELAAFSECAPALCRRYLTPEHRAALDCVSRWMREAGMQVRLDPAGNLIGRYEGEAEGAAAVMTGSHIDTVRDAGRYDGMLGVLCGIEAVAALNAEGRRLRHAIEVVAFGDEEGVRFQATLLGSSAIAGTFKPEWLELRDAEGQTLGSALDAFGLDAGAIGEAARQPADLAGFIEVHIEQGPVLESEGLALGVVTAIAGASRFRVSVSGMAGHAGTVPMTLRHDALCAAAEMVLEVERVCTEQALVGTVGQIAASPGAVNVISGDVQFSLDIRSGDDALRAAAIETLFASWAAIAHRRGVRVRPELTHAFDACACDASLSAALCASLERRGHAAKHLPSGAGHDAMAIAALTPVTMLFVRCEGGISHHPDENMTAADADAACAVLLDFLLNLNMT